MILVVVIIIFIEYVDGNDACSRSDTIFSCGDGSYVCPVFKIFGMGNLASDSGG